jgi:catechol 2,3-dioxygenase-like lactoylglutathione lyase family enzyme
LRTLFLALFLSLAAAHGSTAAAGWQEVVLSVSDLTRTDEFLRRVGGWVRIDSGRVDPAELALWDIPDGVTARYALLRAPGETTGAVRLIEFSDALRLQPLRNAARVWEAGGIGGVNVRIRSIDEALPDFRLAGWQGHSKPVRFSLQEFTVVEVILTQNDGITFTPIERVSPPLTDWNLGSGFSGPFNAFEVVADFNRSIHFYEQGLGMRTVREESGVLGRSGPNIFGLPHDMPPSIERRLRWLHPDGPSARNGTLAVMGFSGISGSVHAQSSTVHALGIVALRMPVDDAVAVAMRLSNMGYAIASTPRMLRIHPFGTVCAFSVTSPDGAWWDIFSTSGQSTKTACRAP